MAVAMLERPAVVERDDLVWPVMTGDEIETTPDDAATPDEERSLGELFEEQALPFLDQLYAAALRMRSWKSRCASSYSSSVMSPRPTRASVYSLRTERFASMRLYMITSGVRSSFTYAGARSIEEFRERALVGVQSAAGYEEGKALPVSW